MATTFTTTHIMQPTAQTRRKGRNQSQLSIFVADLIEDLQEKPLQPAHLAKHDMFREHINAMAASYFGLILLLIAGSLPVLAYLIPWQAL